VLLFKYKTHFKEWQSSCPFFQVTILLSPQVYASSYLIEIPSSYLLFQKKVCVSPSKNNKENKHKTLPLILHKFSKYPILSGT
jgi:hypothetical protein